MNNIDFFPWQTEIAQQWLANKERFSHAWLIHGQEGIGKLNFCLSAAKSLLCEHTQHGLSCGQCQSCHWMQINNHLDVRMVLPDALKEALGMGIEEDSQVGEGKLSTEIRIEQVRQLESFMTVSTLRGGYRVIVLGPAEKLNAASSNALLKILEEPTKDSIFLLFTHSIQKVLPTILSRCRRLPLPTPQKDLALAWLQAQGVEHPEVWLATHSGAPLKALSQSGSPYEPLSYWLNDFLRSLQHGQLPMIDDIVAKLEKLPHEEWLLALQKAMSDLWRIKQGAKAYFFPSLSDVFMGISQTANASKLAELYRFLNQQQKIAHHPLNSKLFIQATLQRTALYCLKG